jgi:lipopolysaccharide export system permease protein
MDIFFIGVDYLTHASHLPNSANLKVLYLLYMTFYVLTIVLPLSLIFAWITTIIVSIKNNELIASYSLGASYNDIIKPILASSFIILFILTILQATPLAYSVEQKNKILDGTYFTDKKENIFLKYNNYFVYFKRLYPFLKKAEDVHIFKIDGKDIVETIIAKKAIFQKDKWYVIDAKIIQKDKMIDWDKTKINISYEKFIYTLEGFKPKILDSVHKKTDEFSILDALYAFMLLNKQDVNTDKIRTSIYYKSFGSFFIISLMIFIFIKSSISSRFFHTGFFTSLAIFATLLLWGILFLLYKLSMGGIIIPELTILLPLLILYIVSFWFYSKYILV